jgi:hypothetical protein
MMYDGWQVERWETPMSGAKSLVMVSLHDDTRLVVILEDARHPDRRRWRVTFDSYIAYLNINESYRVSLWNRLAVTGPRVGWTKRVVVSPWLDHLLEAEGQLDSIFDSLEHYQIGTEDDVIDVVSPKPPSIVEIDGAGPDDPRPGKSDIYQLPEDRAAADRIINSIREQAQEDRLMADEVRARGVDTSAYPCIHLAYYSTMTCPDMVIVAKDGRFGIPVRDGSRSVISIRHCLWCGTAVK